MSVIHQRTRSYKDQSSVLQSLVDTVTGIREINISKTVAIGTDVLLALAVTRANIKSMMIKASTATTIKTNSSGSPIDTIVLSPGQIIDYVLDTDAIARCPFSADVTALYITNAAESQLEIRILLSA